MNARFAGPETYIFASNEEGMALDWIELDGSSQAGTDHAKALLHAGYEVVGNTQGEPEVSVGEREEQ